MVVLFEISVFEAGNCPEYNKKFSILVEVGKENTR